VLSGRRIKRLSFSSAHCALVMVFQFRTRGVQCNNCEDINYSLIQFLSSILLMVLLVPFRVSAAVSSLVLSADSLSIGRRF
jgi:hypothetical protein